MRGTRQSKVGKARKRTGTNIPVRLLWAAKPLTESGPVHGAGRPFAAMVAPFDREEKLAVILQRRRSIRFSSAMAR